MNDFLLILREFDLFFFFFFSASSDQSLYLLGLFLPSFSPFFIRSNRVLYTQL